jgi:hypothetical protein
MASWEEVRPDCPHRPEDGFVRIGPGLWWRPGSTTMWVNTPTVFAYFGGPELALLHVPPGKTLGQAICLLGCALALACPTEHTARFVAITSGKRGYDLYICIHDEGREKP